MAGEFPIYETTKSLPGVGPSVQGDVDFRTGASWIAEAIGDIGGAMMQVGSQMWEVQAEQEFADAVMADRRELNELSIRLEANPDENTYEEEMNRSLSVIQNREIKNGLAARNHSIWLMQATPQIEKYVHEKIEQRINDKWYGTLAAEVADAERTGNLSSFEEYVENGIKNRLIDEKEAAELLIKTKHSAMLQMAQKLAWAEPEKTIASLKEGKGLKEFPELTDPDDWARIRNIAVMRRSDLANQFDSAKMQEEQSLWDLSLKKEVNTEQIINLINGFQYHTPKEKDDLLKDAASRIELIRKGKDPLKTRQNDSRYWEDYQKAVDGEITEPEIRKSVREGWYTINDYKELNNILENLSNVKGTAKEISTAMTDMSRLLDSTEYYDKKLIETAKIKGRTMLEAKIKEKKAAGKPLEGIELTKEMLRIERQLEKDISEEIPPEQMFPTERFPELLRIEMEKNPEKNIWDIIEDIRGYMQPTQEEFLATVAALKASGRTAVAKDYYDKWINELWK